MSLVLYGNGVVDARGSVGGTVLSRGRGGATQRAKTSPTQWQSDRRQQSKAILSTVSGIWQSTLTQAQRAAWNSFALVTPSTNVFGQTTYLTGHQWFCKCSINLLIAGLPVNTGAPASATVPGPITLALTVTHTGVDAVSLAYTDAGAPAVNYLAIYACQPISPGISYVNSLFRQIKIVLDAGSPVGIAADYIARFPGFVYSVGRKVFVLLAYMDGATGIMSPALIANAVIT